MQQLNFIGKAFGVGRGSADVQINYSYYTKTSGEKAYFTFRNGVHNRIAPNTGCIVYAVSDTRMYLKEAEKNKGYKLSKNKKDKCDNHYLSLRGDKNRVALDFAREHMGEYELAYDASTGCWVIETGLSFIGK